MKNRVVSFHYVLKNEEGETLDTSEGSEPMTYVEGKREIISGLEDQLKTLNQGDKKVVKVSADQAYGDYDETLVMDIAKEQFPKEEKIEVGDQFRLTMPNTEPKIFTVVELKETHIGVDGNHPLAGTDLYFDLEITSTREATEADMQEDDCCGGGHHEHSAE